MPAPVVLSGRYQLGELIGRGGMADVYEGRDLRLGRTVAVKMLRPDMARDGQFRARFEREARAVAGLNHPAIVAVYDTGEHNAEPLSPHSVAVPYIVMEYVAGKTLRDVAHEENLTVDESVDYVLGILSALEYSHRHGIVHRDIKPANVMVCTDPGEVKVMDFGIARAMADAAATQTQTQAVVGTAQYLSPEQARGEVVDARTDLYSTGCLLYELLAGRPPFIGESPVSLAYQHVQADAAPASDFNAEVTPALQSVLDRALQKDPDDRFQSAAAFQRALRAARAGVSVPVRSGVAAVGAATAVSEPAADDAAAPTEAVGLVGAGAASVEAAGGEEDAPGEASASPHLGDTGEIPMVPLAPAGLIQFDDARDEERARRGRGRRRTWIVALVIAALLLAAAGGFVLYNYMNQPAAVQMVTVPSVANMTETEAALKLQSIGLKPTIDHPKDSNVPKGKAIRTVPDAGTQLADGSSISLLVSDGPANATIPDSIIGATEAGARSTLQSLGLTVKPKPIFANDPKAPYGTVISTNPGVGQTVGLGTEVELTLSTGKVAVPEVRGMSLDAAQKALSDLGLKAGTQEAENSVVAPGTVTDQSPGANATVDQGGTEVELTLSTGKVAVPEVRGMSLDAAQKALSDLGLKAGTQEAENSVVAPGTVTDQSPGANGTVDQGGTVSLTVAKAPPPPPPPAPSPAPTPSATSTPTPTPSASASKKAGGNG